MTVLPLRVVTGLSSNYDKNFRLRLSVFNLIFIDRCVEIIFNTFEQELIWSVVGILCEPGECRLC